ncbi:MAG: hypothetical protein QOF51_3823 [Chloroflexota bacterium]|jgi:hypothetical protein|nr:hypothetical protein [Chloroflexota bacterium]
MAPSRQPSAGTAALRASESDTADSTRPSADRMVESPPAWGRRRSRRDCTGVYLPASWLGTGGWLRPSADRTAVLEMHTARWRQSTAGRTAAPSGWPLGRADWRRLPTARTVASASDKGRSPSPPTDCMVVWATGTGSSPSPPADCTVPRSAWLSNIAGLRRSRAGRTAAQLGWPSGRAGWRRSDWRQPFARTAGWPLARA